MTHKIKRKSDLDEFLKNIAIIADEKYQERVWVKAEGPECNDIDDAICDFFDNHYVLKRYKDFGITEDQHQLLTKLYAKLRTFTDTFGVYSPEKSTEKLIQLPQWKEIREMSKIVLKSFDFVTS